MGAVFTLLRHQENENMREEIIHVLLEMSSPFSHFVRQRLIVKHDCGMIQRGKT